MCGILGIVGQNDVAIDLYRGMLALQHRGQDSAGMACLDSARVNLRKGVGLVSDVFTDQNLPLMKGNLGIGHVRYGTAGSTPKLDTQPFLVTLPHVVALAHNGNAINYKDWEEEFKDRTESCCDSEILLHLFVKMLSEKEKLDAEAVFDAVGRFMKDVNGSYSIVALVGKLGLIAFRDPHANRPLVMGRSGKSVAFASESVAMDAMGYELIRDLKPGEAILVKMDGTVDPRQVVAGKPRHCMFEWVYFARPDSVLEGKSVYEVRIGLGKELAKALGKKDSEVVVPVPDTSRPAALGLAEESGIPMQEGLIKNRYIGRTFIMPTHESRERAMFLKLNPVKAVMSEKRVLLVDDSIVRGTTARRLASLVKTQAKNVHLVSTCPPIRYPCFYGIDFPIQDELIAHTEKNEKGIAKALGVDALTYQKIDGLKKAIGVDGLCMACLDGNYPTEIPETVRKQLVEGRQAERAKVKKEYHG